MIVSSILACVLSLVSAQAPAILASAQALQVGVATSTNISQPITVPTPNGYDLSAYKSLTGTGGPSLFPPPAYTFTFDVQISDPGITGYCPSQNIFGGSVGFVNLIMLD